MPTDKETAIEIEVKRSLSKIVRDRGADGCYLLTFSHTDVTKNMDTYAVGNVPLLNEVILALATLIATQAYDQGKRDAASEHKKKRDDSSCMDD